MIFMNGLFGYLCLLIVMKWASGSTADLYHTLIYMFLSVRCAALGGGHSRHSMRSMAGTTRQHGGHSMLSVLVQAPAGSPGQHLGRSPACSHTPQPGDVDCGGKCPENQMFPGQAGLQVFLLVMCFVAVPWMLLPKPLILKKRHEARLAQSAANYGLLSAEDNAFRFQRYSGGWGCCAWCGRCALDACMRPASQACPEPAPCHFAATIAAPRRRGRRGERGRQQRGPHARASADQRRACRRARPRR